VLSRLTKVQDVDRAVLVLRWMEANAAKGANITHYSVVLDAMQAGGDWDGVHEMMEQVG
jgi:hypothetical protein